LAVQQYAQTNSPSNLFFTFCPGAAGSLFGPANAHAAWAWAYFRRQPDLFTHSYAGRITRPGHSRPDYRRRYDNYGCKYDCA